MLSNPFSNQPAPPRVNLQETDTVTELCHVGEAVISHDLNKEYRLKHVFVDVGGASPDPNSVPHLSPHEYIYASHQAQRFGVDIEKCVPTVVVGFEGLKKRFDRQQEAIAKQNQMIEHMKQRIVNENNAYRKNCTRRVKEWATATRLIETQLLNLFRKVERCRMQLAAKQGKQYSVESSLGKIMSDIHAIQTTIRNQNLETRVTKVEKETMLGEPAVIPGEPTEVDPEKSEKMIVLLRQSKELLHNALKALENCERDVDVMKR